MRSFYEYIGCMYNIPGAFSAALSAARQKYYKHQQRWNNFNRIKCNFRKEKYVSHNAADEINEKYPLNCIQMLLLDQLIETKTSPPF